MSEKTIDDLIKLANGTVSAPTSCEVLFLDGPMRGRRQTFLGAQPLGELTVATRQSVRWEESSGADVQIETVTYTLKPNRLDRSTKWAMALRGSHVGDMVQCCIPYNADVVDMAGFDFNAYCKREASNALGRMCAEHGLRAVNIRRVWSGDRGRLVQDQMSTWRGDEEWVHALRLVESQLGQMPGPLNAIVYSAVADLPEGVGETSSSEFIGGEKL